MHAGVIYTVETFSVFLFTFKKNDLKQLNSIVFNSIQY